MRKTAHREADFAFPFIQYEPDTYEGKLPLILQLHGAGERGDGGEEDLPRVEVHGFSKLLEKEEYPCMVVMPQCPKGSFWAAKVESLLLFIEQLKKAYPIDENRIYLTGLSMGGFGTWFCAMAKPDLFAAIAPVCGGGMAWNAPVLTMPIWAFHGIEDTAVSVFHSDNMVEKLKAVGADVTYTRLEGVEHNAWDYTYDRALMEWLLSKKRNKL